GRTAARSVARPRAGGPAAFAGHGRRAAAVRRAPCARAVAAGGAVMAPLDLDGMLRRLHLPTVRRLYPELETRTESEGLSHRDFLALLIAEEVAHRSQTRIERSVRKARFPFLRTIEDFDFTFQTSVRLQLLGSYLGPELVNERYLHHRPMLFTTNKPLAAWGLVLHDPDLAEAILDRVLERGRLVELRGASYRTRHLKRADSDRSPLREGAIISGNQGPEFPEPTGGVDIGRAVRSDLLNAAGDGRGEP